MAAMGFLRSSDEEFVKPTSIIVPEDFTHSIAFGETGSGKTTSFIYPNLKHRLELGHGVLLYDYKGKEHLSVKFLAEQVGRLDEVVEVGKPWGKNVNIIQNMDEDQLDKFFDTILDHGKDSKFWHNSAKSLANSIIKVLRAMENFTIELSEAGIGGTDIYEDYIRIDGFNYPKRKTLKSLISTCKSFEHLGKFINKLDSIKEESRSIIRKNIMAYNPDVNSQNIMQLVEQKYMNVMRSRQSLIDCIDDVQETLAGYGEDSNENLTQNIMGSLIAPLINLAQNPYFNTDEFDIVQALGKGKIVIINTESLSDMVVESLNNSILYELSKRTKMHTKHPVSIFIDEVQRMLSKKTDFPVDVFREAKVDLFLATQNSALLKDKLEEDKFEALMGNLTKKYYYRSSVDEELESVESISSLDIFEYLSSEDSYESISKSEPMFVSSKEKLYVEYMYQKKLKVLENYLYTRKRQALVLEYDAKHFYDGKLIAIHKTTMREELVDFISKEESTRLNKEVQKLVQGIELRIKEMEDDEEIDLEEEFEFTL